MVAIISCISAILAGMGIGGGALFVILSTMFLNFDQKYAQMLNLIMFVFVGVSATVSNIKDKKVNFKVVKKMMVPLILGSLIGSFLITKISSENLKQYFSVFLIIMGLYEIITSLIRIKKANNNNK